mmetsp:Transcript_9199/g.26737  ORF Transcript_9199/g.26737 Transcript_9199/m.26737 type:complete len:328 (-) Transcript_9199:248-1231(-)
MWSGVMPPRPPWLTSAFASTSMRTVNSSRPLQASWSGLLSRPMSRFPRLRSAPAARSTRTTFMCSASSATCSGVACTSPSRTLTFAPCSRSSLTTSSLSLHASTARCRALVPLSETTDDEPSASFRSQVPSVYSVRSCVSWFASAPAARSIRTRLTEGATEPAAGSRDSPAAMCRGERPLLFCRHGSACFSSSRAQVAGSSMRAARQRGVSPSTSMALRLKDGSELSSWTIALAGSSERIASCSSVRGAPKALRRSGSGHISKGRNWLPAGMVGSAPFSMRYRPTSAWLRWAAQCKGVAPKRFWMFGLAPAAMSRRTTSRLPHMLAM